MVTGNDAKINPSVIRLTQSIVDAEKPGAMDRFLWDEECKGFFLRVYRNGRKVYGLKCYDGHGKRIQQTIGPASKLKLKDARADAVQRKLEAHADTDETQEIPTLRRGLEIGLTLSRATPTGKLDLKRRADIFVEWMQKYHKHVYRWNQLRPSHVEQYINHMIQDGLAWDSIRMRLALLKFSWARIRRDFPKDILPLEKVRMPKRAKREIVCLDPLHVDKLLSWLKVYRKRLYGMGCLQALAGLRMFEAACLRVQDVNFAAGTITITDTGKHAPKNEFSERKVPVCGEVLEAIRFTLKLYGKVQPTEGEIFRNADGGPLIRVNSEGIMQTGELSRAWRRALKSAAASPVDVERQTGMVTFHADGLSDPIFGEIPARKLRASFASTASRLGASDRLLRAYLGHSAQDVLGLHYRKIEVDELRDIANRMDDWRRLIQEEPHDNVVAIGSKTV